jgi:hypothetical protein
LERQKLLKPVIPYESLGFRVFIMNDFYRKRYFKYESFSMQIDEILNKYFKSIKICTPYDIDSIIILSKKEIKMDFEIEIVVESCS